MALHMSPETMALSQIHPESTSPVLQLRDLAVRIGDTPVLDGVDLPCHAGKTLAVVGESGSGKSMSFLAAVGQLPAGADVERGAVLIDGTDITGLTPTEQRQARAGTVAMIFQDSLAGLSPSFTIGQQLGDVLHHGRGLSRRDARRRALEVLDLVHIPDAKGRLDQYPHELSGGMRQRVMIAMGIALQPRLLVADEPTTALDVTIQEQILELLDELRRDLGMGLVVITHDLGVVARYADEIAVMYAGRIVEHGPTSQVLTEPSHPYTAALRHAVPRPDHGQGQLATIPGQPARLVDHPTGCPFAPRCHIRAGREACDTMPPVAPAPGGAGEHVVACHFADETAAPHVESESAAGVAPASGPIVLAVKDLSKTYGRRRDGVRAVDGVNLALHEGEALGLVGESGCGKSTLSRMILGLLEPTSGSVEVDPAATQIVFQDPYASLDPRQRVGRIVSEPLRAARAPLAAREQRVVEVLERVGLGGPAAQRYPHQFSGGQRQRVGIARAVTTHPRILVLDEPVSALDVSMQAQVLNMLAELRTDLGLSVLLISHDLSVIRQVTDRVAVMYLGRIVETASTRQLYEHPRHPYTEALLSAAPTPDPEIERTRPRIQLVGEGAGRHAVGGGCPLAPRCHRARELAQTLPPESRVQGADGMPIPRTCGELAPALIPVDGDHAVACHFP